MQRAGAGQGPDALGGSLVMARTGCGVPPRQGKGRTRAVATWRGGSRRRLGRGAGCERPVVATGGLAVADVATRRRTRDADGGGGDLVARPMAGWALAAQAWGRARLSGGKAGNRDGRDD